MHINLQYTPIYLDFGSTEAHRYHAEDIYDLLLDYNNNMWIELQPNPDMVIQQWMNIIHVIGCNNLSLLMIL